MSDRVAVLVSGRGSNLRAIFEAIDSGACAAKVVAVGTDKPEAPALDLARTRGVPTFVVAPKAFPSRAAWDEALAAQLVAVAPDFVVLAGFMRIVGAPLLGAFPDRIVNVHPSLLPAFPGAHGPADALKAGVRVTGCTVHFVDAGVDSGKVLAQAVVPILPGDDAASLHSRIQAREHELLPAVIDRLVRGAPEPTIDARKHLVVP